MTLDDRPGYNLALAAVFIALCPIFGGLRFSIRAKNEHMRFGVDDWLVLFALPWVIGCCILLIIGVDTKTFAFPSNHTPPADAEPRYHIRQKLQYVYFIFHPLAMGSIKTSFIFFYRRIFVTGNPKSAFSIVSLVSIVVMAFWTIGFTLSYIFQCKGTPAHFWSNHTEATQKCNYIYQWNLGYAISDLVTDVWVILLPVPLVLGLRMKLRRKLAVIGMFALGVVALAASTTRLAIYNHLLKIGFALIPDPTFDLALTLTRIHYWATLEAGLAFIACNLPTYGALAGLRSVQSLVASFASLQNLGSGSNLASKSNLRTERTATKGTTSDHSSARNDSAVDHLDEMPAPKQANSTTAEV